MNGIDIVKNYYDQNPQIEWERLDGRMPEFEITMRHLKENLKPNSKILDVGGGVGRYSFALTELGHEVTLFDLSEGNIEFAKNKSNELGIILKGYICGNAVLLPEYINTKYDAVLCLGPLYHINNETDRTAVINNCLDILVDDGIIAFGFISAFAKYTAALKELSKIINNESDIAVCNTLRKNKRFCAVVLRTKSSQLFPHRVSNCYIETMRKIYFDNVPHLLNYSRETSPVFDRADNGFTESNFTNPHAVIGMMEGYGIKTSVFTSAECLLTHHNELRYLPKDIYDSLLDVTYHYAKNPALYGSSEHLLYIGRK